MDKDSGYAPCTNCENDVGTRHSFADMHREVKLHWFPGSRPTALLLKLQRVLHSEKRLRLRAGFIKHHSNHASKTMFVRSCFRRMPYVMGAEAIRACMSKNPLKVHDMRGLHLSPGPVF